ncbi:hypothetical protein [Streptomyces sp. SBT349]|nr:hypothetical protein [Streptomyces sp. SBT349]
MTRGRCGRGQPVCGQPARFSADGWMCDHHRAAVSAARTTTTNQQQ